MTELEYEIEALAHLVEWPDGDLAAGVARRLRTLPAEVTRPRRRWRTMVAVAAAVAAVAVAVPTSRAAIGSWFGVRGDRITVSPTPSSTPATAPPTIADLDLGPEVALSDLRAEVGFNMPVPRVEGFDHPDEVHVRRPPAGGEATLLYRARADLPSAGTTNVGMLISAFRADVDSGLLAKTAGPDTRVEVVTVQDGPGYWIEGAPHELLYRDASGEPIPETLRLAANVLVWEVRGVTVRIESALPRDEVVRIADAMK